MITSYGAPIGPIDVGIIVNYLAANYGAVTDQIPCVEGKGEAAVSGIARERA